MSDRARWLAVVLLGIAGAAQGGELPSIEITDPVNLTAALGAKSCAEGIHGGTQTRICRTSHGTYAAFIGKDAEEKTVIHVIRIRDGGPERLASIPTDLAGSNGVQVACDSDQEVFVIASGTSNVDGHEQASVVAIHVDRNDGAMTEHRAVVPFGRGSSFGYGVAFLDAPRRAIYALYSGGDAPGYLAWVRFDTVARRWADEAVVAEIPFRHCYAHGFADGTGGAAILAERDARVEAVGLPPAAAGEPRYVWDELRVFKIPDLARVDHRAIDVEAAVYDVAAGLRPNVQNNFGGDGFVDSQGRMHVLYRSTDNNRTKGSFNRHAVLDATPRLVSNELLSFREGASMRMFESAAGRRFVVAMPQDPPARIQVWGATDADGSGLELLAEKPIDENARPTYAGVAISCPRNGSIRDDVVDALYPSGHDYHHFRIRLK